MTILSNLYYLTYQWESESDDLCAEKCRASPSDAVADGGWALTTEDD